jgi:N-acetyl-D-muramate 6-phosphate phosphatase
VSAPASLQAVLFDLDGTLVDTAPDMTAALNRLRVEHGHDPLPYAQLRPYVSRGSNGLLSVGFGDGQPTAERAALVERFLTLYSGDLCGASRLFDGMAATLEWVEQHALPWGIVTNKPGWLARPLLESLGLAARAGCLVSGDCLPERKPHPRPLLHAAQLLARAPSACVYVGDDLRDVQAGQAAGMQTLVARWGYVPPDQVPADWNADVYLDSPRELLEWLRARPLGVG